MTEEDTFLKLKRVPYKEAMQLYISASLYVNTSEEFDKILKPYGWTVTEIFIENKRYINAWNEKYRR